MTSKYPEHENLSAISDKSQAIGEFIDWLETRSIKLCRRGGPHAEYLPIDTTIEKLLAAHFEIDLDRIEEEKLAMLAELWKGQVKES
jgi:hypothetical protein